jgi:hypothetical protein
MDLFLKALLSNLKKDISMDVRILHNRELWDGFLAQQLGYYSYQTFEWGEYLNRCGHIIFRLGVFVEEQLAGVMLLAITRAPIPAPFSLLNLKWMYCYQGPCITEQHPEALGALLAEAHAIAKREQAIVMRIEAPRDICDNDAYLWHCGLQQLQDGRDSCASDWAKAQGQLHYEMYVVSPDRHGPAMLARKQAHATRNVVCIAETSRKAQINTIESGKFGPIYDFVYRPFFYQLWAFISRGHLPSSEQAVQQMQQQVAGAVTVSLHA